MKNFIIGVALASAMILVPGSLLAADDDYSRTASGLSDDAFYQQTCSDDTACDGADNVHEVILASDSDRGCCVWKTTKPKCVYTNKAFCERKAAQANTGFEFYKDTGCKTIPACQ